MNRSEPAPQGAGSLSVPHDQEACTSRYILTVTSDERSDPDAVIGYDPPLRTFFLQAFPDESGDDLALWLGTSDRDFEQSTCCTPPTSQKRPAALRMTVRSERCGKHFQSD